jgi:glycosyltransferase involved in cell wall biosynthesis
VSRPEAPVSVVIPTWNRWPLLGRAVSSALAEPETREVIVVDDGSDDHSLARLAALTDPRLKVLALPHEGNIARLRNRGAAAASGEWLAFLDSDDSWEAGKLGRQLAALKATRRTWSVTGWRFVDEHGDALGEPRSQQDPGSADDVLAAILEARLAAPIPSLVVERAQFLALGGCDASVFHDDLDLVLRLAATGPPAILGEPLLVITKDSRRVPTLHDSLRHHRETLAVVLKCRDRVRTRGLLGLCHRRCAHHLRCLARVHRALGAHSAALRALAHAGAHRLAAALPFPPRAVPCGCRTRPVET